MKYLFIEIEVYVRDFNSRFLIALEAASRGYIVIMGHRNQIYDLALKNKIPKGIIHKKDLNTTPEEIKIMKEIINRGFIFTAQDEEAGILHDSYVDFSKRRFDNLQATDLYSYVFTWGDRDKKYFEKILKNSYCKFASTGSPRIDLCKSQFIDKSRYFSKRNKINTKFILITSNISFPLSITPLVSRLERIWKDTLSNREFKEKFLLYTQSQHTIILYEFLQCLRFLLENLNDYIFVIRPHTNETEDMWIKIIGKKYDNLKIIKDLTVIDNLSDAELLIHTGCTSAIEAYVSKTPSLYFHPQNFAINYQRKLLKKINHVFNTKEKIYKFIKKNDFKSLLKEKTTKEFSERIANSNKSNLAYIKIVDCFDKISVNTSLNFKYKKNIYFQIIKKILKKILFYRDSSKKNKIFNEKFPDFDLNQIKYTRDILSTNYKKFKKIQIKSLDKKLIKLSK